MSTSQASLHGSVVIEPSTSDTEAALSVLLSGLDDKTRDACMRPESVAMRFSVEESKQSVDLLESALLALTIAVRNRVAVFRTRHNDLMPFNSLPTALVAGILIASFPPFGDLEYSETEAVNITRLQQLASVSRRWRDVVKSCPQLWTTLGSSLLRVVALKLKKSGSLPLTIRISPSSSFASLKDFLSITTDQCHRWSSVQIFYHSSADETEPEAVGAINHTLGLSMPVLQHLRLLERFVDLSRLTNAPLLRHLDLSYISPLDLPASICSTLHTLHIGDLHYSGHAGNMLMNVLGMCTELKNLEIRSISSASPVDIQLPTRGPAVHMPNLERLELSYNDESLYLSVLGRTRAKRLSWLRVRDYTTNGTAVLHEILHSHGGSSLISTVLRNSCGTTLTMAVGCDLEIGTKAPHDRGVSVQFRIELPWQDVVHLLQEQPLPSNTPPVDLRIRDSSYQTGEEVFLVVDILTITQVISQASTLLLECGLSNVRTFFKSLVEANEADFPRQLPNLTSVILRGVLLDAEWEELKPIIHALEARYISSGIAEELPFKIQYERRLDIASASEILGGDAGDWGVAPEWD